MVFFRRRSPADHDRRVTGANLRGQFVAAAAAGAAGSPAARHRRPTNDVDDTHSRS